MATKKGRGSKPRAKAWKPTSGKKKRARSAKRSARSTGARKPKRAAPKKAATRAAKKPPAPPAQTEPKSPEVLDEVIEEPILDASGILKLKDAYARAKHDTDEDETNRFADPSLVVDAEREREGSLFDEEKRRQEETPVPASDPASSSLFGALKKKPEA